MQPSWCPRYRVLYSIPPAVAAGKDILAAADALLVITPQYNNSIPGVLKNAVDWMSRPPDDAARFYVYRDLPVGLGGASPGGFGTNLSQVAWLPVLRTLGLRIYAEKSLFVSRAHTLFGPDGRLTDEKTRTRLKDLIEGLAEFAVRAPRRR
jgi:NAD(P)H-dependent FMN reductase